jgi:hypothetical protein
MSGQSREQKAKHLGKQDKGMRETPAGIWGGCGVSCSQLGALLVYPPNVCVVTKAPLGLERDMS